MSMHRLERCPDDCTHYHGGGGSGMVLYYYSKGLEDLGQKWGFQFEYILVSGGAHMIMITMMVPACVYPRV
jgi:hypothetical protein